MLLNFLFVSPKVDTCLVFLPLLFFLLCPHYLPLWNLSNPYTVIFSNIKKSLIMCPSLTYPLPAPAPRDLLPTAHSTHGLIWAAVLQICPGSPLCLHWALLSRPVCCTSVSCSPQLLSLSQPFPKALTWLVSSECLRRTLFELTFSPLCLLSSFCA